MSTATQSKTVTTFQVKVTNNRGKVVLEQDLNRKSQWSAHSAARNIFRDQPTGSKMTLSKAGKVLEEWAMHSDGWDFTVLNGPTVNAASRAAVGKVPAQQKATRKVRNATAAA